MSSNCVEMSDAAKDPAIKLFGRTIAVPEGQTTVMAPENSDPGLTIEFNEVEKDTCGYGTHEKIMDLTPEDPDQNETDGTSDMNENDGHNLDNQSCSLDDKVITDSIPDQEQTESDAPNKEKILKKPDKILPCPRCNSMDTKFCYYNNYNVNQPRHFCKNCQRYWTAGGTMRNVPVGAGRRKNKHSSSHYRHLLIPSDGIPSPHVDNPDSSHSQLLQSGHSTPTTTFNGNRTLLKFGQEAPLCESMANVLTIADQKRKSEISPFPCAENVKEPQCASPMTASNCMENALPENVARLDQTVVPSPCNGLTPINPLQCYPGPPWAYPWSPGWSNIAAIASGRCNPEIIYGQESGGPKLIPWSPPPMMATPFCAPTMPYPFIPASFWGCMTTWPNGTWNVPWVGANSNLSPSSPANNSGCSGNHSPTLGKHSRDAGSQVEEKGEKSLWIPKTLRIDDPDEAAKSSIWATLGIKPDRKEPIAKGGIFKSFQHKTDDEGHKLDAAQVMQANPAALSRSHTFQEST